MSSTIRTTILNLNSFQQEDMDGLDAETKHLVQEREEELGPAYRLFYRHPVHLVKGKGSRLWDANGEEYLDMYNNVVSVGHCNPEVVEAITRQASTLNTHTRYLHEGILDYAKDILSTMPDEIDQIMFQCTGSEANDLAIRVARKYTGNEGVIITTNAYHGNSALISELSPAQGLAQPISLTARMIPAPDAYHFEQMGLDHSPSAQEMGEWMAGQVRDAVADMERHGIRLAAFLADTAFSSDGVYLNPRGFLKPVLEAVHEAGGVYIADEVQPGFCRTGDDFWGFQRHGIVPDIVTSGKPMANGLPTSMMAARHAVLEPFATTMPYFNTYGGNPVCMAAAQATLNYLRDHDVLANARRTGDALREAISEFAKTHSAIGDVRGAGQFTGCEIVKPGTKDPDAALTLDILEQLRLHHVLTGTCGVNGNILKLRPPLVFTLNDVDFFMDSFSAAFAAVGA